MANRTWHVDDIQAIIAAVYDSVPCDVSFGQSGLALANLEQFFRRAATANWTAGELKRVFGVMIAASNDVWYRQAIRLVAQGLGIEV